MFGIKDQYPARGMLFQTSGMFQMSGMFFTVRRELMNGKRHEILGMPTEHEQQ